MHQGSFAGTYQALAAISQLKISLIALVYDSLHQELYVQAIPYGALLLGQLSCI
jgi:hypothetical protein